MLVVDGDRYRMAVQPGGPRLLAPAAPAQYPHDEVVPRGGNGLTAGHCQDLLIGIYVVC
jgi:hypothetical protein